MLTFIHTVAGEECRIFMPQRRDELGGLHEFLALGDKVLSIDTETTGLDIFSPGHELRLFQIGNRSEAWVLRPDLFADIIRDTLRCPSRYFVAHNAPYDLLVLDRHLGVTLEELGPRVFDTRILAHLLDPRQPSEGGAGLKLKPLSAIYVDPSAPDTQEGLTRVFNSLGYTKATGWRHIAIDHPTYVLYAGLDVILDRRLFDELRPLVNDLGLAHLSEFEHQFAILAAMMERRGFLLDVPYSTRLVDDLAVEAATFRAVAAELGVPNVGSTAQVAAALAGMGETLTERTPTGLVRVDKEVLLPLADLDRDWSRLDLREPNPLADAVLRSKRAEKWSTSYAQAFLDLRDARDRVHPSIGTLQARTARMSISRPPLQQLPSSDWRIRRAFLAEPGEVIVSVDFAAVEMRVLAALSGDPTMKRAIADGLDLHNFTAERVFGTGFTPHDRKVSKVIGLGKVYGGGAATVARQTGAPLDKIKVAMAAYDETFPGIKRYGRRLQSSAEYGIREVVTPSGRHLPLDRDRLYSATNYVVQSTSRDILADAIVTLYDAGMGDYLRLPIHDEVVASVPAAEAEDVAHEIQRLMERDFMGVHIAADPEVGRRSWGSLYSCPADDEADPY